LCGGLCRWGGRLCRLGGRLLNVLFDSGLCSVRVLYGLLLDRLNWLRKIDLLCDDRLLYGLLSSYLSSLFFWSRDWWCCLLNQGLWSFIFFIVFLFVIHILRLFHKIDILSIIISGSPINAVWKHRTLNLGSIGDLSVCF